MDLEKRESTCVSVAALSSGLLGRETKSDYNYQAYFYTMTFTKTSICLSLSSTDSHGKLHEFCPTKMDPPFMKKGDFIWARDNNDQCYECVCEEDIGLACCE